MTSVSKLRLLVQLAVHGPREFANRMEAIITSRTEKLFGKCDKYVVRSVEDALSVLEISVAYGVTTAFVLKALQVNGKGVLHSIDLPPLGENANAYVGYLVPNQLRDRWVLHRGVSTRILPKLLPQLGHLDLFIHDSLHTYWNIRRELNMITPYLARPGVVIVDDIQDNLAFSEWVDKVRPAISVEFQEEQKDAVAGLAVFV